VAEAVDGQPVMAALPTLVGQFAHDVTKGRWWSETMYAIYGFRPGEVVPSVRTDGGAVVELRGYLVDMTEARRRDAEDEAAAAVRGAVRHRAVIEQAKGALMFVYGVDEETAIAILKTVSQHKNVKLNQLAAELMAAAPSTPAFPAAERSLAGLLGDPHAARPFE